MPAKTPPAVAELARLREQLDAAHAAEREAAGELDAAMKAGASLPTRLEQAHAAGDDATVEALRAEADALPRRLLEAEARHAGLKRALADAERAIPQHYAEHLDVFADVAEQLAVEYQHAVDRLQVAFEETRDAFRTAADAWSPVVKAAGTYGLDLGYVLPNPVTGYEFHLRNLRETRARPLRLKPGQTIAQARGVE